MITPRNIALDYDDTFTADPVLWIQFVRTALAHGHKVTFVTLRRNDGTNQDIESDAALLGIPICFCAARQKRHAFPNADIWIDDMPEVIPSYNQLLAVASSCRISGDEGPYGESSVNTRSL